MRKLFHPLSNQQFHFYFSSICVSGLEIGSIRERPNFYRTPRERLAKVLEAEREIVTISSTYIDHFIAFAMKTLSSGLSIYILESLEPKHRCISYAVHINNLYYDKTL